MAEIEQGLPDPARLEQLWSGDFGDEYTERNAHAEVRRAGFWQDIVSGLEPTPRRVLEVGCNRGPNLRHIAERVGQEAVWGIDVNRHALSHARASLPHANLVLSPAKELPFRDRWFDLTFTMGVLIHQPEDSLALVMAEIVRTSNRYVLCGEYHAEQTVQVPYRGQEGALFKRDYGAIYQALFPDLRLVRTGLLTEDEGFDEVTFHLFERR